MFHKKKVTIVAAGFAVLAVSACKTSSPSAAGGPPSASQLASVSVGDVPQDVVAHENQRVWVTVNGGEEQSYTGKAGRKELAQKRFSAGDNVVIKMALYGPELREGTIVAQTKEGENSKCPPKELELSAGANNPTVKLCKADEDGNVDEQSGGNVVEAKPADLTIDACVAGENCEEDLAEESGGSADGDFNGTDVTQYNDVMFVIDLSGSMAGEKWESAKEHLVETASTLAEEENTSYRMNVITFNNDTELFLTGEINTISAELENLQTWLDEQAPSGNTNMKQALTEAFANRVGDGTDAVFLITDGEPTDMDMSNVDVAIENLKNDIGWDNTPIHVHAIEPSGEYGYFLEMLSNRTGGSLNSYSPWNL